MPGKYYWFYLEPYVYVTIKGNDLLLYNTLTGKFLSYIDKPWLSEFLFELNRKENLYALKVSREFLRANNLEDFMEDIIEHLMGDLVDVSLSMKKPFIMPPQFDIPEAKDVPQRRTLKNVSRDSLFALKELTLFVNSRCDNNCIACKSACKQFPWCTREKEESELTLAEIAGILDRVKGCPIKNINILGGDLTQYSYLNRLVDLLGSGSFNVNYYFHLSHLKNGFPDALRAGGPRAKLILLVECSSLSAPGDLMNLTELGPDRLIFLIQRDEEIPLLEEAIADLQAWNISVQPYYNGQNLNFFKANVFIDHESLSENLLDMEVITARKSYNTLNYGKIFIRSNKNIYSDLNGTPLGRLGEISMETAVVLELSEHGNWLRIRRDVAPCSQCLLNAICPPLSAFEYASGINNSCNIREEQRT